MSKWRRKVDCASRVVACGFGFGTFGLASILVSTIVFPLIRLTSPNATTTRRRVRQLVHHCYRFFIGLWHRLGLFSYELHGCERLSTPGQLVVANHPSLIDVLFVGSQMPQVDCIVKDAVLRNPFLRAPVRWAGYIPNSTPHRLIENCVATLRAGNSLLVFPEGTRSVPGRPLKMQRGAAHIALTAGTDLLPVTIVCHPSWLTKTNVWYRVPLRRPHWCITVGEPIRLADLVVPGECHSRSARRVTAHLAEYFSARVGLPAPLRTASAVAPPKGITVAADSTAAV